MKSKVYISSLILVSIINLSCVTKNLPTPQQTVNKPPTSKGYLQVADVIEDRLSWDGDYIISKYGN